MRFVVTGSNRGIGLEFVRQLVSRGEEVDAGVRAPGAASELKALARPGARLRIHALDVADGASVERFATGLPAGPVDVLINNAGVSGHKSGEPIDPDDILRVFDTNAVGTLRMIRALLPRLREGRGRKVVNLSSQLGSIAEASGGRYAYRLSKVALNMATKLLAADLGPDGILAVAVHPGWVQSEMGGRAAPVPPEQSVKGLLKLIDGLTPAQSGHFFDFQGRPLAW